MVNSEGTRGGITRQREPLKSGIHEKHKKEDGMKQSQRLLLTWLIEDETLFDRVGKYIGRRILQKRSTGRPRSFCLNSTRPDS